MLRRLLLPLVLACLAAGLACQTGTGATRLPGNANFLLDFPALRDAELINVVIEIPAGTNEKWEVEKRSGGLEWEQRDGRRRVVQYLAYPANYGMVPRTRLPKELGGDGDPLDVVLLGSSLARGTLAAARPIGVLLLLDGGERDDKIIAVPETGPLSDVRSIEELDARYAGVSEIVETWFTNYKGPNQLQASGIEGREASWRSIREASRAFEAESQSANGSR